MNAMLDDTDNKILALLSENARLPLTTLAKRVALARTTVIARIASLEKRGIIAGYGVRLNQEIYQSSVKAYVGISIDARHAADFIKALEALPAVETLCAVSGAIDYMLTLRCQSTGELDRVLDRIGALDGVKQTATSIILSKRIDRSILDSKGEE